MEEILREKIAALFSKKRGMMSFDFAENTKYNLEFADTVDQVIIDSGSALLTKKQAKELFDEGIALGACQGDGYMRWTDKEFEKVKQEQFEKIWAEITKENKP